MQVTPEQVRDSMIAANIDHVNHHDCGICGELTFYSRSNGLLFFNSGCGCSWSPLRLVSWDNDHGFWNAENMSWSPPRLVSWDNAADWINMQSDSAVSTRLAALFGVNEAGALDVTPPKGTK